MKVWTVKWLVFNAPNGQNNYMQKFFSSEKLAVSYSEALKEAAKTVCVVVAPTIEMLEIE